MKNKLLSVFFGIAAMGFIVGCATTPQQNLNALIRAAGQAYGAAQLQQHTLHDQGIGFVDPAYLVNYEDLVPKVAHVMDGAVTPADFGKIVSQAKVTATPQQAAALGFFDSISTSFVQYNGGPTPTADGALTGAAAKTFAAGMADAVGLVTGTNWTPPSS